MYYVMRASAPPLHRESTDSLIRPRPTSTHARSLRRMVQRSLLLLVPLLIMISSFAPSGRG